jgi:hypothetical protein
MKAERENDLIPIGTTIKPWGTVKAVGYVGERCYWLVDAIGSVSMLPASTLDWHYRQLFTPQSNHPS